MIPWIVLALLLAAAASCFIYRRLRTDRAAGMMESSTRRARSAREALDVQDRNERAKSVLSLLNEKRYEEALEAVERLLPAITASERDNFANYVVYAFEGMAEEQEPGRVLALYDSLHAGKTALAFAEAQGKGDQIAHVLASALRFLPASRNKEGLRRFLDFIQGDAPLLDKARSLYPGEFAEQLDYRAAESLGNWEYGVSAEGLDATLARVRDRLFPAQPA